jgi:hypothetical protein
MAILQKLTTGQLLDRVFQIYRRNFLLFFGIAIVPQFALIINSIAPLAATNGTTTDPDRIGATVLAAVLGLVFSIVNLILSAFAQGAATHAVSDIYLEQPTSIGLCFGRTRPMGFRLAGLSFRYGIMVGVGLLLLVIPGIYWAITYALAFSAMAIEDLTSSDAFARSKVLVAGNRGRIALIGLLYVVAIFAITFALDLPAEFITKALQGKAPGLAIGFSLLVEMISGALAMPIGMIGFTLAYYDARVEKEAFDLHYMMEQETTESDSLPA